MNKPAKRKSSTKTWRGKDVRKEVLNPQREGGQQENNAEQNRQRITHGARVPEEGSMDTDHRAKKRKQPNETAHQGRLSKPEPTFHYLPMSRVSVGPSRLAF